VYALEANWASNWGVGKADVAVSWLSRVIIYFFEEVMDCLFKLLVAQSLLKI